jgi:hypothetical protein
VKLQLACLAVVATVLLAPAAAYELRAHPRILVAPNGAQTLATRAAGPLRSTYAEIKSAADRAVSEGIRKPRSAFENPLDLIAAGLTFVVERGAGRDGKAYADAVKAYWGDGTILTRQADGPFGFNAMV